MRGERQANLASGDRVPDPDCVILARRCQQFSTGTKRNLEHGLFVAKQISPGLLFAIAIGQHDPTVVEPKGHEGSVRRKGDTADEARIPENLRDLLVSPIPRPNRSIDARRDQSAVIRAEYKPVDAPFM